MMVEGGLAGHHVQSDLERRVVESGLFECGERIGLDAQGAGVLTLAGVNRRSKMIDPQRAYGLGLTDEDLARGLAQADRFSEATQQGEGERLVGQGFRDALVGHCPNDVTSLLK